MRFLIEKRFPGKWGKTRITFTGEGAKNRHEYIYRSDDPVSMAMRDYPGLTREEAEEMANFHGS
jgi:hypothetical protein